MGRPMRSYWNVAKRNAGMTVKHQKLVTQDAKDSYAWAKNSNSTTDYSFLTTDVYKRSRNFLTNTCSKIIRIDGTRKICHMVKSTLLNKIWVQQMLQYLLFQSTWF